jgi:simple sugar transport system substrate-binding protein
MIGSVTNNTFWAAVKNGFEQGGKDFGLHAIYSAPGVHSSAGSIPLINSAIAAKPAGISINYTDKSIEKPTLAALDAGLAVTLFNNNRFEPVGGKASTATVNPKITKLAYVGEDSYANAQKLGKAFLPFITKKSGTVLIVDRPGVSAALRRRDRERRQASRLQDRVPPGGTRRGAEPDNDRRVPQAHPGVVAVGLGDRREPACSYIEKNKLSIQSRPSTSTPRRSSTSNRCMKAATDQQPYLQGTCRQPTSPSSSRTTSSRTVNTGSFIATLRNVGEIEKAVAAGKG